MRYSVSIARAYVKKIGVWCEVDKKIFKSELINMLTNRPYDGRNPVLAEVLTGEHIGLNKNLTEITPLGAIPNKKGVWEVTLTELLNYNWDKTISNFGYISEWQYTKFKDEGVFPANIRKSVDGADALVLTPFEMDIVRKHENLRQNKKYFIKFEYNERTLREECAFFCDITLPALKKLVPKYGTTDDVKIVYM